MFGENAQAKIVSLRYAKLPPKLKRSVNMAQLKIATYKEIVTNLERDSKLMDLRKTTTFPSPQCLQHQLQHIRDKASFHRAKTQESLSITARLYQR